MKDITFNSNENKILATIKDFFVARSINDHLHFIDRWVELLLSGQRYYKWTKPDDLHLYYEKIDKLFEQVYELIKQPELFIKLKADQTIEMDFLAKEKQKNDYFSYVLKEKQLVNPFKTFNAIFKKHDFNYYHKALKIWLAKGLQDKCNAANGLCIFPLYGALKKIILACWLIFKRTIDKNSFTHNTEPNTRLNFALTEPSLFVNKDVNDPFSVIESLFSFTNLSGYRKELQIWYQSATVEDKAHDEPNNLLFIFNQYQLLIQAGYFIVANNVNYHPQPNRFGNQTMAQWLGVVRDQQIKAGQLDLSDETARLLTMQERANPLIYCRATLTHQNVIKLRLGLKEWLDAGLSKTTSIYDIAPEYIFDQYITLQKLTEAFYLIITAQLEKK